MHAATPASLLGRGRQRCPRALIHWTSLLTDSESSNKSISVPFLPPKEATLRGWGVSRENCTEAEGGFPVETPR